MPKTTNRKKTTCGDHTPCPDGYSQWHFWAEHMSNTGKKQEKCDECGRLAIWRDNRGIVRRRVNYEVSYV
jgi:hypothetical protein